MVFRNQDFYGMDYEDTGGFGGDAVDQTDQLVNIITPPAPPAPPAKPNYTSKLKDQILAQKLTGKWQGEGKGSAEANAEDMARILNDIGITDIKEFGKVTQTIPGYTISTDAGEEVVPDQIIETYGNKLTGQAVPNTYSERQSGNAWGGTFEGSGNTGYRVQFGPDGTPYFYTTKASSNDLANLMADLGPVFQIGLAFATGGLSIPQQIAAQLAVNVLSGQDIGEAIKGAAISMALAQIPGTDLMKDGGDFIKGLNLGPELTNVVNQSFHSAVSSGAQALLTGRDIGDAMLAGAALGGVNGAINALMNSPEMREQTKDLTPVQKRMIEAAASSVISGKPLDQALVNAAVAGASAEAREQAKYKPLTDAQIAGLTSEEKTKYENEGPRGLKLYQDEVKATNRDVKNLSSLTDTGRTGDDMGGSYDTSAGGASTVTGAAGNDSVTSGAGTDTVTAGSGSDPLVNNLINAGLTQETDNTVNLPSGTQLAAANTGTASDAGGGAQVNISGYPRYAEHADVKTLTPPPGYKFVSVADADNKPEGAYLDYSLNKNGVWVAPTGFTDVNNIANNADADLFNITSGTLGTGQSNETAAGLGVNAGQTEQNTTTEDDLVDIVTKPATGGASESATNNASSEAASGSTAQQNTSQTSTAAGSSGGDSVINNLVDAGLTQTTDTQKVSDIATGSSKPASTGPITEAELKELAFNRLGIDKNSPAMADYVNRSRNLTAAEVNSQLDSILENWHNRILSGSGQDLSYAELRDKIADATSVEKNATSGTQDPASVTSALVSILNDSKSATSTTSGASTASGSTGAGAETSGAANTAATSGSSADTSTGGSRSDTVVNDLTNAGLTQNTDTQQVSNIATGSSGAAATRAPTENEFREAVSTKLGLAKDSQAMTDFFRRTTPDSFTEMDSWIDQVRESLRNTIIRNGGADLSDAELKDKLSTIEDPQSLTGAFSQVADIDKATRSTTSGGSAGSSTVTGGAGSDAIVNDLSSAGLTQSSGSQQASDIVNSSGNTSTDTAASGTQQTATDSSSAANTNTVSKAALNLPVTADGIRTAAFDKLGLDKDSPAMDELVIKSRNFTQGELDGFLDTQLQNLRNKILAQGGQDLSNAELRNKIFDATSVAKNANNPAGNPKSVAAVYNQVLNESKGSTATTTGAQQVADSATGSSGTAAGTESNTAATGGNASQQTATGSSGAATGSDSVVDNLTNAGLTQNTAANQVSTIAGGSGAESLLTGSNTASNTQLPLTAEQLRNTAFEKLGIDKDSPAMAELVIKSRNFTQGEFDGFADTLLQNWRNKILAKGGPDLSNAALRNQIFGVTSGANNAGSNSANAQTVASAFNTVLNNNTAANTTTSGSSTGSGATGSNSVVGGSGVDTLTGGSGTSQTGTNTTTDGIDTVLVGSGGSSGSSTDSTTGDTDTDNVIVSTGRDTAQGGTNNSTVIGGTGNTAATGGGNNVVITGAAKTCPVGTTLNTLTGECEPVQVASTGTQGAGASTKTGGTDTVVVTGNNKTCPAGTTLNPITGECDTVVTSAGGTKTNTNTLTCPAGMVPNEAGTQCIPQTIIVGNRETCPAGTTLNTLTGNCDPVQTTVTGGTGIDTLPGGSGGDTTPGASGDDWRIHFDPVKALDEFYNPFTYQSPKTPSQTDTGPIQLMTDIFGTDISKAKKTGARGYELDLAKGGDIDELLRILRSKI